MDFSNRQALLEPVTCSLEVQKRSFMVFKVRNKALDKAETLKLTQKRFQVIAHTTAYEGAGGVSAGGAR